MSVVEISTDRGMLVKRGYVVDSLAGAIRDGDHGLKLVPGLLKRACNEQCWRERLVEATGEIVRFDSFVQFIEEHPPEGLGVDLDTLKRLCIGDQEARDIIDRETRRPAHRPVNSNNVTTSIEPAIRGNTAEYALSKLRTDAPELHRQVLDGALSPHAAMVEAGFRRKTITVPIDPERAARTIARHFPPNELRSLISELSTLVDWGQ